MTTCELSPPLNSSPLAAMGADAVRDLRPEGLPGLLGDVARVVGVDAAVKIARYWHGDRYIPAEPARDHPLSKLVGVKAARLIGRHFGGNVDIPTARSVLNYHDARRMRRQGATIAAIAHTLRLSEGRVRHLCQGVVPGDPRGGDRNPACPVCGRRTRRAPSAEPPPLPLFPDI